MARNFDAKVRSYIDIVWMLSLPHLEPKVCMLRVRLKAEIVGRILKIPLNTYALNIH